MLKMSHGYAVREPEEGEDPLVVLAEKAMDGFSKASAPGAFLVDFLPWSSSIYCPFSRLTLVTSQCNVFLNGFPELAFNARRPNGAQIYKICWMIHTHSQRIRW